MALTALKKILPESLKEKMRPSFYKLQMYKNFYADGGKLYKDRDINEKIASRIFSDKPMPLVVRSPREFRRWCGFGTENRETMHDWMTNTTGVEVVWDFGAANGLEGFYMNHIHDATVIFVEPFTPSIETILKTIYHQTKLNPAKKGKFEVLQAVIDDQTRYQRLDIHDLPIPGETRNAASDGKADYCHGGRADRDVTVSQWLSSVCMDDMLNVFKLPAPTHIKIDVDGYELKALHGAKELIKSGCVKEWCIEVTDDKGPEIEKILGDAGYKKVAVYEHYPDLDWAPKDYIFVKKDAA